MTYYKIIYNAVCVPIQTIVSYEMGDFDLTVFWDGKQYKENIPSDVRLYIDEDDALSSPDILPNPVSWLIVSNRIFDMWQPIIHDQVQIFEPPIFRKSDEQRVEGYKLLNPICVVDCVNWDRSEFSRDDDDNIMFFNKLYIDQDRVCGHSIFRIAGFFPPVIVDNTLVNKLVGIGQLGFAFWKCASE